VYAAGQLVKDQHIPSAGAWEGTTPLNIALVIAGVVAFLGGVLVFWG